MSLLWPNPLHIGLFPEQSWISRRGAQVASWTHSLAPEDPRDDAMLQTLEAALIGLKPPPGRRFRPKAYVLASDSIAAIVPVPWQAALRDDDEWRAYALACFHNAGRTVDEHWVMHVEFRRFGCAGLAYAFKRDWLEKLTGMLAAVGLEPASVMPVSACVYASRPSIGVQKRELILLGERDQITAVQFDAQGMVEYDVEPVVACGDQALARIMARRRNELNTSVSYWSALAMDEGPHFQDRPMQLLPVQHWRRFQ